jgi:hypothetical protein
VFPFVPFNGVGKTMVNRVPGRAAIHQAALGAADARLSRILSCVSMPFVWWGVPSLRTSGTAPFFQLKCRIGGFLRWLRYWHIRGEILMG